MRVISILENLTAEGIFGAIAIAAGYLLFRRQNRSLARLLGATENRRVLLLLPDMRVKPGGVEGLYRQQGAFAGSVVTRCEFEAAIALRDALTDPLLRLLGRPRVTSGSAGLGESGPVEGTRFCPPRESLEKAMERGMFVDLPADISNRSLVLFGGPIFNPLTEIALRHTLCQVTAEMSSTHEWTARICAGPRAGEVIRGGDQPDGREYALIQSYSLDSGQGPTITTCAGTSEAATLVSVNYLLSSWKRLRRRCGSGPFAIILAVDNDAGAPRCVLSLADGEPFIP